MVGGSFSIDSDVISSSDMGVELMLLFLESFRLTAHEIVGGFGAHHLKENYLQGLHLDWQCSSLDSLGITFGLLYSCLRVAIFKLFSTV